MIHLHLNKKAVIIYDGFDLINLHCWHNHVKHILTKCGIYSQSDAFIHNMRFQHESDLAGFKLKKPDGVNCGPIACMRMWYDFCPDVVNLSVGIADYISIIVTKVRELNKDRKETN